jgi:hypothetical protein
MLDAINPDGALIRKGATRGDCKTMSTAILVAADVVALPGWVATKVQVPALIKVKENPETTHTEGVFDVMIGGKPLVDEAAKV